MGSRLGEEDDVEKPPSVTATVVSLPTSFSFIIIIILTILIVARSSSSVHRRAARASRIFKGRARATRRGRWGNGSWPNVRIKRLNEVFIYDTTRASIYASIGNIQTTRGKTILCFFLSLSHCTQSAASQKIIVH